MIRRLLSLLLALCLGTLVSRPASAFCGFYVSGGGAQVFNNATQVVLMRDGLRTVLSMQNNYQGPPEKFAMVVPVPIVLQKENVKTLPKDVFRRVDELSAPRLVEYWEQDPCTPPEPMREMAAAPGAVPAAPVAAAGARDLGVKVEAQFTVGEYEIVILSAKDSGGLDTWLRREKYVIPAGAEAYLRPYVQQGSKFFVAKVDPTKVKFDKGMATLSPLRFHYDTPAFSLPVRLGLMNSNGTQDVIVSILAKNQRFEVANYPNVTIPTNLDVAEAAREDFGAFYAALFDRTLEKSPKAVVTEYSWDASSCDPCPTPPLSQADLATLGADVLTSEAGRGFIGGFTLTRLHARYTKDALGDDLIFKQAPAITGGREWRGEGGKLEHGAKQGGINNFQGRYAIRHPWKGEITCKEPRRGIWGGPPQGAKAADIKPAVNLAFAARGKLDLPSMLRQEVPEIDVLGKGAEPSPVGGGSTAPTSSAAASPADTNSNPPPKSGCGRGCASAPRGTSGGGALMIVGTCIALLARRRRAALSSVVIGLTCAAVALGCDDDDKKKKLLEMTAAKDAGVAVTVPTVAPAASSAAPPAEVKPVVCPADKDFKVTDPDIEAELRLKLSKPKGDITIADLAKVRSVNLTKKKQLDTLDPCLFPKLKGLHHLYLGPGKLRDLSPIAGLTQLESLRASINEVEDLKPLEKLVMLDRVDLGRTHVRDLTPLANLVNMTELELDDTPVDDVAPLASCKKLEKLSIKRTHVTDVSALRTLTKLKFLYVEGCAIQNLDALSPLVSKGLRVVTKS